MDLRDYQKEAIQSVFEAIKTGDRSLLIKSSVGSGKTFIAKSIYDIIKSKKPDFKFLFVVPNVKLVEQSRDAFKEGGTYCATLNSRDLKHQITFATAQSICKVRSVPRFDIVFFDEVHKAKGQHEKLLAKIRTENPRAILLGLTATDDNVNERLNLKRVCNLSLVDLTKREYLCPLVIHSGNSKLDVSTMKVVGNSYDKLDVANQLADKMEKQVNDMISKSIDRNKVIILCTTIAHAQKVEKLLIDRNCITNIYHSRMTKEDRDFHLKDWQSYGKFLVSVNALTEGFDFPPSDCLVFFRPTRSPTLYEQACGRIARLHDSKKNGLILDYGGVIDSLGLPYDISVKKRGRKDYKECSSCSIANALNVSHCTSCDEAFTHTCKGCAKTLIFGEKCCEIKIDRLKNLTERAYIDSDKFKSIYNITLHKHTSKAGKECLKVVYWKSAFSVLVVEYFSFPNRDFYNFRDACFDSKTSVPTDLVGEKFKAMPKSVYTKKINGYDRVVSMSFY